MSPTNWLNPSAGDVALPSDPREVDAAVRASRISWRVCPYYAWRYGGTGEAFSRSDSAWLVTLTPSHQDFVNEQVDWLAGLLSNRGAPRWLLEMHLEVLYRLLVGCKPEKRSEYEKLTRAALFLASQRRSQISEERGHSLAKLFAEGLGEPDNRLLLDTGWLLVAAVADEKAGVKYAVTRLESWITDPARFAELQTFPSSRYREDVKAMGSLRSRWPKAVRDLIEEARS